MFRVPSRKELGERIERAMYAFFFHALHTVITRFFSRVLSAKSTKDKTLDELTSELFPTKQMLRIAVAFVVGRFIPIPVHHGVYTLDSTIWVGVLSFEGALGLGIIAVSPFVVRASFGVAYPLVSGAIRSNVLRLPDGTNIDDSLSALAAAAEKHTEPLVSHSIARMLVQGGFFLFSIIICMPLGIWVSPHWEVAMMAGLFMWVLALLDPLFVPALLLYNDRAWAVYEHLKARHDADVQYCKKCRESTKEV